MLKIRVNEENKTVELFAKTLIYKETSLGEKLLIGIDMAGNASAVASVYASLYLSEEIEIVDDRTGAVESVHSTGLYRRTLTKAGDVRHCFALPRNAVTNDYQEELYQRLKENTDDPVLPSRTIVAKNGNIREMAGNFLADAYGLPKTWKEQYIDILKEHCTELKVQTTSLSGSWKNMSVIEIEGMKESDVLKKIEAAITDGRLQIRRNDEPDSIKSEQAQFEQNMSTEDYLRTNANILASKVEHHLKPIYDGKSFLKYIGETERVCVPAQARAVMGSYHVLKKKNGVFNVGDMGTGSVKRSTISAA
ncbi:hypothetical protein [Bacillus piscicola]|uniref:hypothetical protein n=1 Tax=Bacillus piscicola TaxID=1632684 RepID=UPI001F095D84|nr:hypothetical protein [Bacillus piscicola]